MGDISLRFPHVFGAIICKLDDKDLTTYRLVSKTWKNSIDNNKCLHLRIINKIISNSNSIYGNDKAPKEKEAMAVASAAKAKNWKHFLLKAPIDVLKEISEGLLDYRIEECEPWRGHWWVLTRFCSP